VTFKPRLWEPIAWILSVGNVVATWFAARPGETWHATTHAVLAALFALWALHLRRLRRQAAPDEFMVERLREIEARFAEFDQLPEVEARVAELEERLDFVERALVDAHAREQLPPQE
jgi:hypothetical protein